MINLTLNERIKYVHGCLINYCTDFYQHPPMTRSIKTMGFLHVIDNLIFDLESHVNLMDTELTEEESDIDYERWLNMKTWSINQDIFNPDNYILKDMDGGYSSLFQSNTGDEVFDKAFSDMRQSDMIRGGMIAIRLADRLQVLFALIKKARQKSKEADNAHFASYLDNLVRPEDIEKEQKDFKRLLKKRSDIDVEVLKDKQHQCIYRFLKTNFFALMDTPSPREVKTCRIQLDPDRLGDDMKIEDVMINCTRLSKYVTWKDSCIKKFNKEKLGRYIYMNHLEKEDVHRFVIFYLQIAHLNKMMLDLGDDHVEKESCENVIKAYIQPLEALVNREMLDGYRQKWNILFARYENELSDNSNQRKFSFNRRLVCNIIGCMKENDYYTTDVGADLAKILGGKRGSAEQQYINVGSSGLDDDLKDEIRSILES